MQEERVPKKSDGRLKGSNNIIGGSGTNSPKECQCQTIAITSMKSAQRTWGEKGEENLYYCPLVVPENVTAIGNASE